MATQHNLTDDQILQQMMKASPDEVFNRNFKAIKQHANNYDDWFKKFTSYPLATVTTFIQTNNHVNNGMAPEHDLVINDTIDDPEIIISGATPNDLANNLMTVISNLSTFIADEELMVNLLHQPNCLFYNSGDGSYSYDENLFTFLNTCRQADHTIRQVKQNQINESK